MVPAVQGRAKEDLKGRDAKTDKRWGKNYQAAEKAELRPAVSWMSLTVASDLEPTKVPRAPSGHQELHTAQ